MGKQEFAARFELAANFCRSFTQSMILEDLPISQRFNFLDAYQHTLDKNGYIKFIGGRLLKPEQLKGLERSRAGQFLWVDGKIPIWINLHVENFDQHHTYIQIAFTDRLTNDHERLMHRREGNPPFHVLGPPGGTPGEKIHFQPI